MSGNGQGAEPAIVVPGANKRPIIYLAGRYSRREELAGYARSLIELGLARVEARWLTENHDWDGSTEPGEGLGLERAQQLAMDDLEDLGRAYGATDPVEGCVWRVERRGVVDFLTKYVRPDKIDGSYLPKEIDGVMHGEPIWNWRP